MSIVKSLSNKTVVEVKEASLTSFIGWERLRPYLEDAIGKKPYENVIGIEVDSDGIKVKLEHTKQPT